MARHLIMGYYTCNLGHSHSSDNEMIQCNRMEEEKQKREYHSVQENHDNRRSELTTEQQRLALEQQKIDLEKEKLIQERERMKHEQKMAELELHKMQEKNREKSQKSKICAVS